MEIVDTLLDQAQTVRILPRRLVLDTQGLRATGPMLRGVWGAALHDLDREAYNAVFAGGFGPSGQTPGYVIRPTAAHLADGPAVDWLLFGRAIDCDAVLRRAWDVASGMGLGRKRTRFHIRHSTCLGPDGRTPPQMDEAEEWNLGQARWPLAGPPADTPCRLRLATPLRMLERGRLISRFTLADLVVAALRRLEAYAEAPVVQKLKEMRRTLLAMAQATPCSTWQGERMDFERYPGSQRTEVRLRGFVGTLDLPKGPGHLWPLLASARWLHLGKGTVMGLGQLEIEPLV